MQRLISIVMLLAVGTQMFWGSGYLIDYYTNSDYYLERCENKLRPGLNCDGKCILSQKLKEQEQETEQGTFPAPLTTEYVMFSSALLELQRASTSIHHIFGYLNLYQLLNKDDIFKPPV